MANYSRSVWVVLSAYFVVYLLFFLHSTTAFRGGDEEEGGDNVPIPVPAAHHGTVVKKDQRYSVVKAEYGEISAVKVNDGRDGFYHLQFITMEPNSLFLPVYLHSDMVFYVDSGSGTLSWVDLENKDDKLQKIELRTGDVYRLRTGSFFYLQSNLDSDRRKLRIHAIFSDSKEEIREGKWFGAYSSVRDLVLGFDDKVLQAALAVDLKVIQELRSGERQPMIVHGVTKGEVLLDIHYRIMRVFLGRMKNEFMDVNKKSKDKDKAYNILEAKHDVENCNGWSLVVTSKNLEALKDSDFSIFLVNLTKGAMMGPHWNPMTAEITIVLNGRGMVHVVCPSAIDESECKNSRFRVEEGDVFVVPRYHPMTQISFNNGSFVFVGFTTTQKKNHPQYLVGSASVFQVLDKKVLATSLGVSNTTMDEILSAQREAIILECTSCAEEEERLMEDEIQREEEAARKREEEERKREEEEERKREEEEAARRQREQEEEAARKAREEAERRRREQEEEAARQAEEEAERQRREQEEAARQAEEEAARHAEEEAARRRREQEEAEKQAEEEATRQAQEEAERRRREQEEAEKQAEEDAARQAEEDAARQAQEEAERRRREQEEVEKQAEEEAARQKREQEEEAARQQEEESARQEEEAARQQEEEAARQEEEAARQQEEEAARQEEEARQKREQEEEAAWQQQEAQEEAARRKHEDEARQQQEQEEVARKHHEEAARQREWHEEAAAKHQHEEELARQQEDARQRQQHEEDETYGGGGVQTASMEAEK